MVVQDVTEEWGKRLDFFKLWNSQCINRPSCYSCPYANQKRNSDFTCGDFIGIENLSCTVSIEEGVSVLIVNTKKAQEILPQLSLTLFSATQQQCLQQGLEYPAAMPKERSNFWLLYQKKGIEGIIQKYGKMTLEKRVVYNVIVPICKKLGIYHLAAKLYLKR